MTLKGSSSASPRKKISDQKVKNAALEAKIAKMASKADQGLCGSV